MADELSTLDYPAYSAPLVLDLTRSTLELMSSLQEAHEWGGDKETFMAHEAIERFKYAADQLQDLATKLITNAEDHKA